MQPLRFLHIPKTAGTTFTQILQRQYSPNSHFQFSGNVQTDLVRFNALSDDLKSQINVFTGHAPIKTGQPFIDGIDTITILRNPIDRVKSYCQHVYEGKDQNYSNKYPDKVFDLDEFLFAGYFELNNLQTQMLINTEKCAINLEMDHETAINLAFENLTKKLKAFGLLEYFDESVLLFQQKFNWTTPTYNRSNFKNKDDLLDFKPRHIERIKLLNKLDIRLYEKAKSYFIDYWNSDVSLQIRLIDFHKENMSKPLSPNKTNFNWATFKNLFTKK